MTLEQNVMNVLTEAHNNPAIISAELVKPFGKGTRTMIIEFRDGHYETKTVSCRSVKDLERFENEEELKQTYELCLSCGNWHVKTELLPLDTETPNFLCKKCLNDNRDVVFYCTYHNRVENVSKKFSISRSSMGLLGPELTNELRNFDFCKEAASEKLKDKGLKVCEKCGTVFSEEYKNPYNDKECLACITYEGGNTNYGIHSYHNFQDRLPVVLKHTEEEVASGNKILHIGAELEEVGNSNIIARAAKNIFGDDIETEHDGTVDVECITHPWSLGYWEKQREKLTNFFKIVNATGGQDNDISCGLHMHIDRSYFNKFAYSMRNLATIFDKHWNNLVKFSRRESTRWCSRPSWSPQTLYTYMKGEHSRLSEHAVALNFQHANTVEIRLWGGTTNINTLFATLKLTQRLAELANTLTLEETKRLSWKQILGDDEEVLNYWNSINGGEA